MPHCVDSMYVQPKPGTNGSLAPICCYYRRVATCKSCGEEVESLVTVKVGGKSRKLCEDCADRVREEEAVAEQSESVVQNMMGFKGRR